MTFGLMTSQDLCQKYLQRIQDFDVKGSQLRAVIEINPDALEIARSLDEERKAKGARGFLHGVPVLIKDNHRYGRQNANHCWFAGAGRRSAATGFLRRRAPACSGCSHSRQNKFKRVGELPLYSFRQRVERTRRPDEESLRARSQPLRIKFRNWRGHFRQPGRGRCRHRNRWLRRLSFVHEWHR